MVQNMLFADNKLLASRFIIVPQIKLKMVNNLNLRDIHFKLDICLTQNRKHALILGVFI